MLPSDFRLLWKQNAVTGVWMRDLLGGRDNLEGLGQGVWIGRLRALVGKLRLSHQTAPHNLVRGSPIQHALPSPVVGLIEALEQGLQILMAVNGDAQHLALHPTVEALDEAIGLRRVGLGHAMLYLQLAAGCLKAIRREA